MKLWEITQEQRELEKLFLSLVDQETGEIKDLDKWEQGEEIQKFLTAALVDKAEHIVFARQNLLAEEQEIKSKIDILKAEAERMEVVRKRKEKEIEALDQYIIRSMLQLQMKKIATNSGNISFRKSVKTVIFDKKALPEEFHKKELKEVVTQPLEPIKEMLELGFNIPGVKLVENFKLSIK